MEAVEQQAADRVLTGTLGEGCALLVDGAPVGIYTIEQSWKPRGTYTVGLVSACVQGVTYRSWPTRLEVGSRFVGYTEEQRSSKLRRAHLKGWEKRAAKRAAQTKDLFEHVRSLEDRVREVRRAVIDLLREADPRAHSLYAALKYCSGDEPALTERREAYLFAFRKLLEVGYREAGR